MTEKKYVKLEIPNGSIEFRETADGNLIISIWDMPGSDPQISKRTIYMIDPSRQRHNFVELEKIIKAVTPIFVGVQDD